jgi:hypothetical protein
MNTIVRFVKEEKSLFIGSFVGGVGGFLFWYYVGCSTGFCPVISSPVLSVIGGALFGAILFSAVIPKSTQSKTEFKEIQ